MGVRTVTVRADKSAGHRFGWAERITMRTTILSLPVSRSRCGSAGQAPGRGLMDRQPKPLFSAAREWDQTENAPALILLVRTGAVECHPSRVILRHFEGNALGAGNS